MEQKIEDMKKYMDEKSESQQVLSKLQRTTFTQLYLTAFRKLSKSKWKSKM